MAGAFLQLVPQLGHLSAYRRKQNNDQVNAIHEAKETEDISE